MEKINKNSKLPLYMQLVDIIMAKIEEGGYLEHDKLPSERELCELYDVSRITVRQTLQELEREGFIYKKHGKGSFVAPKIFDQSLLNLYSFTEEMKKLNKTPSSNVLDFELVQCSERLAAKLEIADGEGAYKVTRLRLADGEPLIYENSYVPASLFPGLTKTELENTPMYDIFREKYGVELTRAVEKFVAVKTRQEEAKWLKVSSDTPSMMIKRYAYSREQVIEYTTSIARGDKFYYTVELT